MITRLALAFAAFVASGAFAQNQQPGAEDFLACQEAVKKNDFDTVISTCEKAIAANADLFASNYYLGFAYKAKQNWGKCASNFDTFLQKVGNNPDAGVMIGAATREGGLCYARGNANGKAVPLLRKAASAKPNDKEVQFFLGLALMRTDEGAAEQAFAKVIQLDPNLAQAEYYAGRINFNRQEWAKANERLTKYLELKPNDTFSADAHFMVGSMAIRMAEGSPDATAQQDKAIQHLEQFLAAKPNAPQSPQAHYILGSLAAQRDDNETAKGHFEKYLELEPNGAQAEEVKQFLADLSAQG
jgi:tetratricopeptide (TPR) repeat protein